MDITPQDNTTQSISDDQELAKALAGVLPDDPTAVEPAAEPIIATPGAANPTSAEDEAAALLAGFPIATEAPAEEPVAVETPAAPVLEPLSVSAEATTQGSAELDSIKSQALTELRPLIGQVELPAEERFDAYLMLLRSTDDPSLVAPAHSAAQEIADEKRKAEALLEIIKEIDYLSRGTQSTN